MSEGQRITLQGSDQDGSADGLSTCPHLDAAEAAMREADAMLDRSGLRHLAVEDPGWGLARR